MVVGTTTMTQMINPEVMAAMISAELPNKIRFSPLAEIDNSLVGRPGNTLTVPTWSYIGDAADIAEGQPIPLDQMATSDDTVIVKKAGKGVEITDEVLLSGLGDPAGEAESQLLKAIASKIDSDLLTAALTTTQTVASIEKGTKLDVEAVQAAIEIFDDEDDEEMILICSASDASALRKDALADNGFLAGSELGAAALVTGVFGEVLGCQIVRSNKVTDGAPVIIKKGALRLVMKRNVEVEKDRDIVNKTTVITADEHYAAYLYDASKVVKITTALA